MVELTRGFRGTVFLADGTEYVPAGTEVVKHEENLSRWEFATQFIHLRIANILLPGHFPVVTGCAVAQKEAEYDGGIRLVVNEHTVFSKLVPTPHEHQIFCSDMTMASKKSTCQCSACAGHREFHDKFTSEAELLKGKALGLGLYLPTDDPSDWCVNLSTGLITFFEVDKLDVRKVREMTDSVSGPERKTLLQLCNAYEKISS